MPSIYLKQTTGTYYADTVSITVQKESYSFSNLFERFKHTYPPKPESIWIFKGNHGHGNYLTLNRDNGYTTAKLQEAHVYFNKYDTAHEYPLILVLKFENGGDGDKYYKWSQFKSKFTTNGKTENITSLQKYDDEKSILKDLLAENDSLTEPLTYQIGKKKGDNGNGNGEYNNKKITVKLDSEEQPKLSGTEFTRYKHTPANGNGGKKACVIYDGNVLLQKGGGTEVPEIQNQQYDCIRVYMGDKAKKTSVVSGSQIDVPLLIELNKTSPPSEPEYYVHKRDPSDKKYYWEKLPGSDGNGEVLCNLLTDMGFGMTSGERGYEKLKQLLTSAGVNGVGGGVGDGEDLSKKLGKTTGKQLQTLLSNKIPESNGDGGPPKSFLELLLTRIEFDLLDSVVILLEKTNGDGQYNDGDVRGIVRKLDPQRDINRVNMNNGGAKQISVSNKTVNNGKDQCVKNYKYKVYEHNFNKLVEDSGKNGKSYFGIRFIMPRQNDEKYNQLMLYNGDKPEPQNLEYKYYHKSGRNGDGTSNKTTVYVWFYNGNDEAGKGDPRPLLLCYGGSAYAPKDEKTYFTQWAKVNLGNGTLKECGCSSDQENHVHQSDNNKLLKELDKVVKFLNTVNLKAGTNETGGNGQPHHYPVQTFQGKPIQIEVKCSPVGGSSAGSRDGTCSTSDNTSCYKKFKHTPTGMTNNGDNGSGYRLGAIEYRTNGAGVGSGELKGTLDYKNQGSSHPYHPLVCVSVYYYDKDTDYKDPLLIELEFKTNGGDGVGTNGNPKEYYKLKPGGGTGVSTKDWELDNTAKGKMGVDSTAVQHLDSIRYSLKPVIKIYIEKQTGYDLCLCEKPGGGDKYSPENTGKQIQVEEYTKNGCSELKESGYVCYEHKVSEITGNGNWLDYNQ